MATVMNHPRKVLDELHFRAKKRFSQNFLTSSHWAERLCREAVGDGAEEAWEIGPGLGAITEALLKCKCRVRVFEIDPVLSEYLRSRFPGLEVVEGDFLNFSPDTQSLAGFNRVLVSNLPYHVSSQILFRIMEWPQTFER